MTRRVKLWFFLIFWYDHCLDCFLDGREDHMTRDASCPRCASSNIYNDGSLWICPDCAHEVTSLVGANSAEDDLQEGRVYDAFGNLLQDGDSVIVIKDLRVKGASGSLKVGTKVKSIRLVDANDGHNIACRIEGFGSLNLKSEFVKKT